MKKLKQIIRNIILESVGHPKMDELIQRFLDDPRNLKIYIDVRQNSYYIEMMDPDAGLPYLIKRLAR